MICLSLRAKTIFSPLTLLITAKNKNKKNWSHLVKNQHSFFFAGAISPIFLKNKSYFGVFYSACKNHQIRILSFQFVAKNIEGWLNTKFWILIKPQGG
jgi:hypothetical protein